MSEYLMRCRVAVTDYTSATHLLRVASSLMSPVSEVVPSPLAEQQQEDGQRHRLAGTLEPHSNFWVHARPRARLCLR